MSDALIGKRLGHCKLVERIGEGGMGSVYRARHETLEKDVAVKVLAPAFRQDNDLVQRMLREARLAARIEHPGIVSVQDAGVENGIPYLVMPFVKGRNLDDILKDRKRLKPSESLSAVKKAARAFAAAHKLGIVHRDVKPGNLIVTTDGQIKVTDFGLAVAVAAGDPRLTRDNCVVGTPQFMSPEQVTGDAIDARTDIYSLGATLYNLLSGEAPFAGGTALSVAMKHADPGARPRPIRELVPDLAPEIAAIVDRMLGKKPDDRFPDMESVIRAIDAVQATMRGETLRAPVLTPAAAAAPAVAIGRFRIPRKVFWIGVGAAGGIVAFVFLIALLAGPRDKARRALAEANQFAATASTPEEMREAARRYGAVATRFKGSREAKQAASLRTELEDRAENREEEQRRAEEARAAAAAAERETKALAALEEAERMAMAAGTPEAWDAAARRFGEIATTYEGTRSATLAASRQKEMAEAGAEKDERLAMQALMSANQFAVKADTPQRHREAAERYRRIAERYPDTRAAQEAREQGRLFWREAGPDDKPAIPEDKIPIARQAVEARARAFLDVLMKEVQTAPADQMQDRLRKVSGFVDPQHLRNPLNRAGLHLWLSVLVGGFRREGWRVDRYAIDRVEVDGAKREATLAVRLILKHATLPQKELPHDEIWVLRGGEWYLLPENRKKERRPLRKPGGRPGGEGRDRLR